MTSSILSTLGSYASFIAFAFAVYQLLDTFCPALTSSLKKDRQKTSSAVTSKRAPLLKYENPNDTSTNCDEVFGIKIRNLYAALETTTGDDFMKWLHAQKQYYESLMFPDKSASATNASASSSSAAKVDNSDGSKYAQNLSRIWKSISGMSGYKLVYAPVHKGKFFFYFKRDHSWAPQPSLYYTKDIKKEGKLVLDLSYIASSEYVLRGTWVSNDGCKVAYGISTSSAETTMSVYVRDVVSSADSATDSIHKCSCTASVSWLAGHVGFFYATQDTVRFHKLGTMTKDDVIIFSQAQAHATGANDEKSGARIISTKEPTIIPSLKGQDAQLVLNPIVSIDDRYLMIEVRRAQPDYTLPLHEMGLEDELGRPALGNKLFIFNISRFNGKDLEGIREAASWNDTSVRLQYIMNQGERFFFRTNYNAANFRVVEVDIDELGKAHDVSPRSDGHDDDKAANSEPVDDSENVITTKISVKDFYERIRERTDGAVLLGAFSTFESILVLQYLHNASHDLHLYDLEDKVLVTEVSLAAGSRTRSTSGGSAIDVISVMQPTGRQRGLLESFGSLPITYCATVVSVNCSHHSKYLFYQYEDFSEPSSVYRASFSRQITTKTVEFYLDQLCRGNIPGHNSHSYESRLEWCETKAPGPAAPIAGPKSTEEDQHTEVDESTQNAHSTSPPKIPLSIFGHKSKINDPKTPNPCIILVHGCFGASLLPTFSLPLLAFCREFEGIVCVVSVRGGGELGRGWHKAGVKENRSKAVHDLIAAAESLIEIGLTAPGLLSVISGSIGATIVAAAANKRPDLFSSIVLEDGIFDVCRSHVIDQPEQDDADTSVFKPTTMTDELGSVCESKSEAHRLMKLCPLRNAELGFRDALSRAVKDHDHGRGHHSVAIPGGPLNSSVPAVMILTGYESAVSPVHSFKFVAHWQNLLNKYALQKHCLLRVESPTDVNDAAFLKFPLDSQSHSTSASHSHSHGSHSNQSHNQSPVLTKTTEMHRRGYCEARKMAEILAFITANMKFSVSV